MKFKLPWSSDPAGRLVRQSSQKIGKTTPRPVNGGLSCTPGKPVRSELISSDQQIQDSLELTRNKIKKLSRTERFFQNTAKVVFGLTTAGTMVGALPMAFPSYMNKLHIPESTQKKVIESGFFVGEVGVPSFLAALGMSGSALFAAQKANKKVDELEALQRKASKAEMIASQAKPMKKPE